jgi:cell division protein FtsL
MNSAAKMFNQGVISRSWVVSVILSRTHFMTVALVLTILTSALAIVYVTNASRSFNANVQQVLAQREQLHIQWGQLLLEKSSWVTQARVQQTAEHDFGMAIPTKKSVVIINE